MGAWGFVFLAYGIVWGAILIYWATLKRRLRRAQTELAQLRASEESQKNVQT
jgi:CcmD family protein